MNRLFFLLSALICLSFFHKVVGQVAIGTGANAPAPEPTAVLLLVGNNLNQGLIIPSVPSSSLSLPTFGKAGMVVYNSTNNTVHYHNGTAWNQVGAGGGTQGIQISGNTVSLTATPNAGFGLSSPAPAANTKGQLLTWNGSGWESTPTPNTTGQTLSWDQTTGKWTISAVGTVTLSGDVSGATTATTISNTGVTGNNIIDALNNLGTFNKILESRITPGSANQVLTTNAAGTSAIWANPTGGSLPSLSANQLLSNNGSNTGINVGGDLSLSVTGTTGAFTVQPNTITNAKLNKSGIPLSGFGVPTVAVDFGNQRIVNLATPIAANDATTKTYVDVADAAKLNSSVLTTSGDILYNDGTSTTRLPRGANGNVLQATTTGIQWAPGGGSGEINTASNVGIGGIGTFKQKTGVNLEFRNINTASARVSAVLDAANDEIDIDVDQTALSIGISQLTGTLGVPNGGTGVNNLPSNSVLLGNGTGAISSVTGGSPTQVLTLNGSSVPVWQAPPGGVSNVTGSGPISVANGSTVPVISISQANAGTAGFLSASDFSTFSAKQNALTFGNISSGSTALTVTGGTGASVGANVNLSLNTGTGANQLVQLDGTGRLPAVDGSQLTGLPGGGDINGVDTPAGGGLIGGVSSGTASLRLLNGSATGQVLKWDNPTTSWVLGTDDVGSGSLPTLSDGQVVISVGANNPQGRVLQQDISVDPNSGNVTVQGLRNIPISAATPSANQVLKFNAGTYSPAADNDNQNLSVGGTGTASTGETFPLAIAGGTGVNIIEGTNVQIDRTGSNLTINSSGGGAPTGSATGDLAGSYPSPTINTSSATTGGNIITAINTASAATINTARLNSAVVLDTENPVAGDITGTFGTGFQIGTGAIAGTDLANNITISTTGNITGANVIGNGAGLTSLNAGNFSSGTLAVARGGTGITAVTPGGIAYGGASNFAFTPAGTAGQLLQSNGAGAPTWVPAPTSFTTVNTVPKGSAGGLIASQIFDNGTSVGIGTSTPSFFTEISSSGFSILKLRTSAPSSFTDLEGAGSGGGGFRIRSLGGANTLTFQTGGNIDRMTIDGTGNIGIGTAAPGYKLDVSEGTLHIVNSNPANYSIINRNAAAGNDSYMFGRFTPNYYVIGTNKNGSGAQRGLGFSVGGADDETSIKMSIGSNGNVGIGASYSTIPTLHAYNPDYSAGLREVLRISGGGTAVGDGPLLNFQSAFGGFTPGSYQDWISASIGTPYSGSYQGDLTFYTNNGSIFSGSIATPALERMRITSTGNIGIGTNSPQEKLTLFNNTDAGLAVTSYGSIGGAASTARIVLQASTGLFVFPFMSREWTIESSSTTSNNLDISVRDATNTTPAREFTFSTTAFYPSTDNSNSLGRSINRWTTVFASNGTINTSDIRLKENIQNINYGLNEVMKLRPVSYNWKTGAKYTKLGLIAQETEQVIPEVVSKPEEKDGYYGLLYSDLIPVLIKAAQELNQKNESLEKENTQLKAEVAALKQKQELEMGLVKKQLEAINTKLGMEAKKD